MKKGQTRRNMSNPLSVDQERFWLLSKYSPRSKYLGNIGAVARYKGKIEPQVLKRALNRVVNRHSALRTYFSEKNNKPIACITEKIDIKIQYFL